MNISVLFVRLSEIGRESFIKNNFYISNFRSNLSILISSILFFCTLVIRAINFTSPETLMVDEIYYVPAANSLLESHVDPNYVHPPLGKLLISSGILFFGYNSFGWRIASIFLGSIIIPIMYLLSRKIFNDLTAIITSALLIFDPLMHVMSRIAMLDIFLTLFITLAFLGVCYDRLGLTSIAFGLACGVKLVGAFAVPATFLYLILVRKSKKIFMMVPIAAFTFLLSLLPIIIWSDSTFLSSFVFSVNWHLNLAAAHPSASSPIGWLINILPFPIHSNAGQNINATTNPFVYPISIPVAIILGYEEFKKKNVNLKILPIFWLFFVYGIFFLLPRKTQFIFYLLPTVPAILLLVSVGIERTLSYVSK